MFLASLTFSGWNWLWPAAGAMGVALLLLIWNYRAAPRGVVRWVCLGLKLLGLAALALCLLEPLWSGQRAKPGGFFNVLRTSDRKINDKKIRRLRFPIFLPSIFLSKIRFIPSSVVEVTFPE